MRCLVAALALLLVTAAPAGATFNFDPDRLVSGVGATWLDTGDLDGDGNVDIVTGTEPVNEGVQVAWGDGTGEFPRGTEIDFGNGCVPAGTEVVDMNDDDLADLVTACADLESIRVRLGQPGGGLGGASSRSTGAGDENPLDIAVADFDGDGAPDVAMADNAPNGATSDSGIRTFFGDGSGGVSAPGFTDTGATRPARLAVIDWDDDGDRDILVAHAPANGLSLLTNNGGGTFAVSAVLGAGSAGDVVTGDFTGDLRVDFAVATPTEVAVFRQTAPGAFTEQDFTGVPSADRLTALDADGDRDRDLVVMARSPDAAALLENNGAGVFAAPVALDLAGVQVGDVAGADFDEDGAGDLVVGVTSASGGGYLNLLNSPLLQADTAAATFSPQTIGTVGPGRTLTFTNNGEAPLPNGRTSLTGDDWVVAHDGCTSPVPQGGSCSVSVKFAPQGEGDRAGSLALAGRGSTATVTLGGSGQAAPAAPGPQGPQGPAGPPGPQGPAAPTAPAPTKVTCAAPRIKKGKVRVRCSLKAPAGSAVSMRLLRGKKVLARARGTGSGGTLKLALAIRKGARKGGHSVETTIGTGAAAEKVTTKLSLR